MLSKEQINEVVATISKRFCVNKIIIFGSYAYGNPVSDSDLDICVITDLGKKRKIDVIRDIRKEMSLKLQNSIDILLYEENEFNERAFLKSTLEHEILKNGILVNG